VAGDRSLAQAGSFLGGPMGAKKADSSSFFQRMLANLKRLFRRSPEPEPEDPHAYRMAPKKRPPRSRSGAAVAELDEE
jgi:hypothetical protein